MKINFEHTRSFLMSPIYRIYSWFGFVVIALAILAFADKDYRSISFILYFSLPIVISTIDVLLIIPNHFHNKRELKRMAEEIKQEQSTEDSDDKN